MSHLIEKIRSVKFQLILIFLAFSVVSASGIAGISLSYLFRAEREMAVDQAVRYSEVIGASSGPTCMWWPCLSRNFSSLPPLIA